MVTNPPPPSPLPSSPPYFSLKVAFIPLHHFFLFSLFDLLLPRESPLYFGSMERWYLSILLPPVLCLSPPLLSIDLFILILYFSGEVSGSEHREELANRFLVSDSYREVLTFYENQIFQGSIASVKTSLLLDSLVILRDIECDFRYPPLNLSLWNHPTKKIPTN